MPEFVQRALMVPIDNWWWVVGLGIAALVLLVVALRATHTWARWVLGFCSAIVALVAVGLGFNVSFQAFPTLGALIGLPPYVTAGADQLTNPTRSYSQGAVVRTTIAGDASGLGDLPAHVWLPPQWFTDTTQSFPVAYLLHGVTGFPAPGIEPDSGPSTLFDNADIQQAGLVAANNGQPMVIVAPMISPMDADTECVDGPQGKWQTYLTEDVPAWVKGNARLLTGAQHTAIGGYSLGGYCAQVAALRDPENYSVAGNLSGTVAADYPADQGGYTALFGSAQAAAAMAAEYDSTKIIESQPASRGVRVWMRVGKDDDSSLRQAQEQFAATARSAGMTVVASEVPGGHDFSVWRPGLAEWLQWAANLLYAPTAQ